MTARTRVRVLVETTPKKTFASALDWPGLSRSGRDEEGALEALRAAAPRYARIATAAGERFDPDAVDLEVTERADGDATTAFGAPSIIGTADRAPVTAAEATRLAAFVAAAWTELDRVASTAPDSLRTGPRGGGRDTSKVVAHVDEADAGYASVLGLRHRPDDRRAVLAMRRAVLEVLGQASDGSPIAGKKWPPRYTARRIAWHALDHAWEIEDRS